MKAARVVALTLFALLPVVACQGAPFIVVPPNLSLREDADAGKLVVYGTLRNPRANADGSGTTELVITSVIKWHPILGDKKVPELPRYIPVKNPKEPPQYLIFFDLDRGKLDPFRGIPTGPVAVGYLKGLLALDGKDRVGVMRYCSHYLEHSDPEIASDAFLEYMNSSDADIVKAGRDLPADNVRGWLQDPKTPSNRLRLYGFLLGHCGKPEDTDLLRKLAENNPAAADGILTACVLLKPREEWARLRNLLKDGSRDFALRYSALRTARFFYNTQSDLLPKKDVGAASSQRGRRPRAVAALPIIPKKDVIDALSLLLDQADIADLPITDLCRWRCWDLTDRILAVAARPSHNLPLVRRAVLRYALQCPGGSAAAFVAEMRKTNPTLVKEQEELLLLEAESEPPPPSVVR